MNKLIQLKHTTSVFLAVFLLACFTSLPRAQGVTPAPDGGYPGFNTAEGENALLSLDPTTGVANTAIGWLSLSSNVDTGFNTAVGAGTLLYNAADENTAIGAAAMLLNTTGSNNTAVGAVALLNNTEGSENTASGVGALSGNTTGANNTATGFEALFSNTTGGANTANGYKALQNNTTGYGNTAIGVTALQNNTSGVNNTAVGDWVLVNNTTGNFNTAVADGALVSNTTGNFNTAVADGALLSNTTGGANTAIGASALQNNDTGSDNTAVGTGSGVSVTTANNVITIGANVAGADVSNTTWIGNVYGVTTQSGTTAPVIVSDTGQLGTIISSERFKKDIATMDKTSEAILSLRPVTFHYKRDAKGTPQFGLIAEEVAKVNPALVLPDKEGKLYTVRYDAVNAMLLNEFLKEHRKNEKQEATIAKLKTEIATLFATVKEQSTQIQKVTALLQLNKPAPKTVSNNK